MTNENVEAVLNKIRPSLQADGGEVGEDEEELDDE